MKLLFVAKYDQINRVRLYALQW